ncbi:MAG: hypothetical protein JSW66_17010 [Phycisphaerales bacterium]|nr:MAG: hypothetical protein JSW66_17010 [Phycisphaerales bacterium]
MRQIAHAITGAVGLSKATLGGSSPPVAGAIRLEQQTTGSEIWQVTTEQLKQSNIYCEIPYCSRDSKYFVYERRKPAPSGINRTELMVVEIGSWKQHLLDVAAGISGSAISHDGVFYYLKQTSEHTLDLMRTDLSEGKPESISQMPLRQRIVSMGTVSPDGRYYAWGKRIDEQYTRFGVLLIDLQKHTESVIDEDPCIFNPHPQFEPDKGRQLLIQHNRGGKFSPDGKLEQLVGPEGATLYLLSISDSQRTSLQVGTPYTTAATGHQAWIAKTGEILLTVSARDDHAPPKGNLLAAEVNQAARVAAKGYRFNHVNVSPCGRFFCCDDWQEGCKIVIGSIETGRIAVVCESKTSRGRPQNTHAHAYLTPDLKWVIFNSDRNGFPHIHAATVPAEMIQAIA